MSAIILEFSIRKIPFFFRKAMSLQLFFLKHLADFFNYFNAFVHRLTGDRNILYLVLIQWGFMGR